MIRKGEVGNTPVEGRLLTILDPGLVRAIIRKMTPGLCIGHHNPAYFKGRWNWAPGWWAGIQDGIFIRRESTAEFMLYWEISPEFKNTGE